MLNPTPSAPSASKSANNPNSGLSTSAAESDSQSNHAQIGNPLWRWLVNKLANAGLSRITLVLPNRQAITLGEAKADIPAPTVELIRLAVVRKAAFSGVLGWGEAYVDGDWDTPDLIQVTEWAMHNAEALETTFAGSGSGRWLHRLLHRLNDNTLNGSRRNISAHYDLGNDFYRLWLDEGMTYSSALYNSPDDSLSQAQQQKYDRILELLAPDSHSRVLEIGCGWGGFAERLLQLYPESDYHGVTLSEEQLAWTQERLHNPCLQLASAQHEQAQDNKVLKAAATLTDYREIQGQYDRIASIEMLEAVGEKHWPTYFETLYQRLAPGGSAVLQVITIAPERFEQYSNNADFIQRHVFPGGMLPTPEIVQQQAERAGLCFSHSEAFGQDYATTLKQWRDRFEHAWPEIESLELEKSFDERFRRLWRYYLCYCESGFRHNSIDVYLFKLDKPLSDQSHSEQATGTAL
ncbi:SAM-dependent methyltransferase [Oceanospirillum beijerinckii]|uniref:SAM-dependent methyltransferase n=1 Tax=Oceanospirillum beijerinckii TaxID=64976 RepID=UPI000421AA51|nr:cyclopropane-fatty-acyl-phospholipid synthase family protein [Oceanospirillum beijerinckii]